MEEPKIAMTKPAVIELEPGDYKWCACGLSSTQPFCDSSHKSTSFSPVLFKVEEKKRFALCQCKHTATKPFCNGTHRKLG